MTTHVRDQSRKAVFMGSRHCAPAGLQPGMTVKMGYFALPKYPWATVGMAMSWLRAAGEPQPP